jgi:hypothetical protein
MVMSVVGPLGTFSVKRDIDNQYVEDHGLNGILSEDPIGMFGIKNQPPLRFRIRDQLNTNQIEGEFETKFYVKAQRGDVVCSVNDNNKTIMVMVTYIPDQAVPRGYLHNVEELDDIFKGYKLPTKIYLKRGYSVEHVNGKNMNKYIVQNP